MQQKQSIAVNVGGHAFTVLSDDPPAHVQLVAALADRTLRETARATRQSTKDAVPQALIALADEVIRLREENARLKSEKQAQHR